jgi:hypothetical protein
VRARHICYSTTILHANCALYLFDHRVIEIECYNRDRIKKGRSPLTFKLVGAATISNLKLEAQFVAGKQRLIALGRDGKQLRVQQGFHGTFFVCLFR